MALKFNMQPYHPMSSQDTQQGWEESGASIGYALKGYQDKYGTDNVAYNEAVAAAPEGESFPPKSQWLVSDEGKAHVQRIKNRKKAKFAEGPLGRLLFEQIEGSESDPFVSQDKLNKARREYHKTSTDYYGWDQPFQDPHGGFSPQAFEAGGAGLEGWVGAHGLEGIQDKPWFKEFVKDAEKGKWEGGPEGWQGWQDVGKIAASLIGGAGAPSSIPGWYQRGWQGMTHPEEGEFTQKYGTGQEGFKKWLEDRYTMEGEGTSEYRLKGPLGKLFSRDAKGRKDSTQVQPGDSTQVQPGTQTTVPAGTNTPAGQGLLGKVKSGLGNTLFASALTGGQKHFSYTPPQVNQGAPVTNQPPTTLPQPNESEADSLTRLQAENEKLKQLMQTQTVYNTSAPGYYSSGGND